MSQYTQEEMDRLFHKEEIPPKDVSHRPICPECGKQTIILFTPPKKYLYPEGGITHPDAYTLPTNEKVDWERAHLYCCNASTNCKFNTRLFDLGRTNVSTTLDT